MKKFISFFAGLPVMAMLLTACNSIDNADLSMGSIIERQRAVQTHEVNVSLTEANGIADRFVGFNAGSDFPLTKSADSRSNLISTAETVREDGQDLMYVFNYEDGGWVIVGSTRNYYPILAYSDKGSFVLQEDMGPVDVWLDETKVCIKNSHLQSDEAKAQMHQIWARYDGTYQEPSYAELAARRPQTRSTGEDYCWDRIDELQALYGSEGWTFLPLSFVEDVFTDLDLDSYYYDICYSAYQNHSALNETVIGYRTPAIIQVGPLLETEWHQEAPFSDSCPPLCPAGCSVIAAAQVMKYYEYPETLTWNGDIITWADIPVSPNTSPNKIPKLIRRIGQEFQANYNYWITTTTFNNEVDGLTSLGYLTDCDEHDELTVRSKVFNYHQPVIMRGSYSNNTTAAGHTWVCDGCRESRHNEIQFFTENQPYGTGVFTQGMYSYNNPGLLGGVYGTPTYTYHMNWGLKPGQNNTNYNGWYSSNDFVYDPIKFHYIRLNIYPSVPPGNN